MDPVTEIVTSSAGTWANGDQTAKGPQTGTRYCQNGTSFCSETNAVSNKMTFLMTINKSQGQTVNKVGIYLPEPDLAKVNSMSHYQGFCVLVAPKFQLLTCLNAENW